MAVPDPETELYGDIGPVVTRGDVEQQTLTHVRNWLSFYLARIEEKRSLTPGRIARPKSFEVVNEFQRYPEDALPFVAVISPGLSATKPRQFGDGMVTAWWNIAVGAILSA